MWGRYGDAGTWWKQDMVYDLTYTLGTQGTNKPIMGTYMHTLY